MPKLIVGLGNPTQKFAGNRHNIGYMVVEQIAKEHKYTFEHDEQADADVVMVPIHGQVVYLVKPTTYMNNSGDAVKILVDRFGLKPKDVILIYDDMDIELGRLRWREAANHGGHNGVRSVIDRLGTREFPKVKVGIGRPAEGVVVLDHVLSDFDADQEGEVDEVIKRAAESVDYFLTCNEVVPTMNHYNN